MTCHDGIDVNDGPDGIRRCGLVADEISCHEYGAEEVRVDDFSEAIPGNLSRRTNGTNWASVVDQDVCWATENLLDFGVEVLDVRFFGDVYCDAENRR